MRRRTLLLLRHAEAAPPKPHQRDRDRPLTARGRTHAEELGKDLARRGITPEIAVASDARRAMETLALVTRGLEKRPRELIAPELYDAEKDTILAWLRQSGGSVETILMVGHNPSVERFAAWMATGTAGLASRIADGYPPATLAVWESDVPTWAEFAPHRAELTLVLVPPLP